MTETKAAFTAPYALATETAQRLFAEGANAIEAMVGAAATIAVSYPHMNGLGGDAFWLIDEPGKDPVCIDAAGPAAAQAHLETYKQQGFTEIPALGPWAAGNVAGTVDGWRLALEYARDHWGRTKSGGSEIPLSRLLGDAVQLAEDGISVSGHMADAAALRWAEFKSTIPEKHRRGFMGRTFPPVRGDVLCQPELAATLGRLAKHGLRDFYSGDLARDIATDLRHAGSPLMLDDLQDYHARFVKPLQLRVGDAVIHTPPPPSQGGLTLGILGMVQPLWKEVTTEADRLHFLIEAVKRGLNWRARNLADRPAMKPDWQEAFLGEEALAAQTASIDLRTASPWPRPGGAGDTIWMGAMDADGRMVSFIQSLYWGFGSAMMLRHTGILWQNRTKGFVLAPDHPNALKPGRRPMHTLAPAMARFDDGRRLSFGTMGGDGQAQTLATIFSRYGWDGVNLQQAVSAPRFVLGKSASHAPSNQLVLESRIDPDVVFDLEARGHSLILTDDFDSVMGHAGAIARDQAGLVSVACDPRSDGRAFGDGRS